MPTNTLHHDKTLANRNTEAKYAKCDRRWSRYGRNGETHSTSAWKYARKAYNRAARKASRLQLSRYQAPVEEYHPVFTWEPEEDWHWEDLRTQADMWYEEKLLNNDHYR